MSKALVALTNLQMPKDRVVLVDDLTIDSQYLDMLLQQGIVEKHYANTWWCESCMDDHYYVDVGQQFFKTCPNQAFSTLEPVTLSQRLEYGWNDNAFAMHVCDVNGLTLKIEKYRFYSVLGTSTSEVLVFANLQGVLLEDVLKQIRDNCGGVCVHMIHNASALFTAAEKRLFERYGVKHCSLTALIKAGFVLQLNPELTDEHVSLIVDAAAKTVSYNGVVCKFEPNEKRFFNVFLYIAKGNGQAVSGIDYSGTSSSDTFKVYVSTLRKILSKHFNIAIIDTHHGDICYSLSKACLPVKILS